MSNIGIGVTPSDGSIAYHKGEGRDNISLILPRPETKAKVLTNLDVWIDPDITLDEAKDVIIMAMREVMRNKLNVK